MRKGETTKDDDGYETSGNHCLTAVRLYMVGDMDPEERDDDEGVGVEATIRVIAAELERGRWPCGSPQHNS